MAACGVFRGASHQLRGPLPQVPSGKVLLLWPCSARGCLSRRSRSFATLSHLEFDAGGAQEKKTALVMHGILGNKVNMRTFSKNLAARNPSWRFILLDHRGHGGSPSPDPPHTVEACAADAVATLSSLQPRPAVRLVIGHSFGGKVALEVARQLHARGGLDAPLHAWVLDSVPGLVPEDQARPESVSSVIAHVGDVPMPVRSKEHLLEELGKRGISKTLANWMTTNLQSDAASGGYVWKFDVQLIDALFRAYKRADYMPFLSSLPARICVRLVMASRSQGST
ncbi:unnamed protein product [Prorocentrum cordatum]|uniref:AB hydrolase-1 domain-containing protein n=1 Tax=Prorocentrum cordatum TaxID=2364126 RepID=A0ABN9QVZ2_9DINO|nr:unnamed protein product [Polarella glacialis]